MVILLEEIFLDFKKDEWMKSNFVTLSMKVSLPIISGSNSDLKGAQTFTLNPSLVAAVATSLQYIPAPPLEGGYS